MPVKCNKCGANIPDSAAFCPNCGAAKPSKQAPSPPAAQPTYQKPSAAGGPGLKGLVDTFFSKLMIMLGVGIGIFLGWISRIINQFITFGIGNSASTVIGFTGLSIAGFMLLGGGFLNKKIDKSLRMGMIITGGIILAWTL